MSIDQLSLAKENHNQQQPFAAHRIKSVSIVGGFMDGVHLDLSDGLNCLIGARGTGKTTTLELIRYALDALPTDPKQRRRIESLVKHNLGCRVEVAVETSDGMPYILSHTGGEPLMVLTSDREPTEISLKASGLFGADVFSQNEIERIADDPHCQLNLIDNFESKRIARIKADCDATIGALRENASRIAPLRQRLANLREDLHLLPAVQQKLHALSKAIDDDSGTVNQAHARKALRDREEQAIRQIGGVLDTMLGRLEELKGQIGHQITRLIQPDMLSGPNGKAMQAIGERAAVCGQDVDDTLAAVALRIRAGREDIAGRSVALAGEHQRQELEFRQIIERHKQAQQQAAERSEAERTRNRLLTKQREHEEANDGLRLLRDQRKALLKTLGDLRNERFTVRQRVVKRINDSLSPTIRVSIVQEGEREDYRLVLQKGFAEAGVGYRTICRKIAHALSPGDLASIVRNHEVGMLAERAGLQAHHAVNVITALQRVPDLLFELDTLELPDRPQIQLKDGGAYKASDVLSTGQKCTAILPILLLDSQNPLLIDQPEDNLDNGFVYQTLVPIIRKVKQRRQLIFITHNPNIPVLGNAERVFVLGSDGATSRTLSEGTVDECKPHIITLLEGGQEAFRQRKERYEC